MALGDGRSRDFRSAVGNVVDPSCACTRGTSCRMPVPHPASPATMLPRPSCMHAPCLEDVCKSIHKSLVDDLHYALVWGVSAKHAPQRVGGTHVMEAEDVIQIVKRKG